MTWTAAAFAAYSPKDRDEYAKYAHHGIEYLDRVMRDKEHGGFHWIVGADGKLDPKLGDEKHVYGTAFVLYAASKVYEVTRDELALKPRRTHSPGLRRRRTTKRTAATSRRSPARGSRSSRSRRTAAPIVWVSTTATSR